MNKLLLKSSYYYDLPHDLIAQTPAEKRDESRLLIVDRSEKALSHRVFSDIIDYLNPGDCLVVNDTKVIPARLFGTGESGGQVELVLLKRVAGDSWECLVRPGKRAKIGMTITIAPGFTGIVRDILDEGTRLVEFSYDGIFQALLEAHGALPLPPYITQTLDDQKRYQTVYAKHDGSAAAPTAGLHFTPELLGKLREKGVQTESVLLHVGLGTFRPVREDDLTNHKMHHEYIHVTPETAERINTARKNGGRIIAVGTTSARVLESVTDENGTVRPFEGETGIFIYPGYKFKAVDALITNFHLPESTLIMLVAALAGYEQTMEAYQTAVAERYRFFSFGDAMFIK